MLILLILSLICSGRVEGRGGGGGIHSFTPPPVVFTLQQAEIKKFMYRVQGALASVFVAQSSYLCTYDLYSPVCVHIHYKGGGGWALDMESFLGPVKWHRANRPVPTREVSGPLLWGVEEQVHKGI
jgi:hypothetical protein